MGLVALCLGGAPAVWSDLAAARDLTRNTSTLVIACNFTAALYDGRLDALVTLHPERVPAWRQEREAAGRNTNFRTFIHEPHRAVPDAEIVPHGWYGSSGLYMAQVALQAMGCTGAILCGVPMDDEAGHIHWGKWPHSHRYRDGFLKARADGAPIRSMSGWSAEIFGRPDADWLHERS